MSRKGSQLKTSSSRFTATQVSLCVGALTQNLVQICVLVGNRATSRSAGQFLTAKKYKRFVCNTQYQVILSEKRYLLHLQIFSSDEERECLGLVK